MTDGTTINHGGVENVLSGGTASGVAFKGPDATLNLATPLGLEGTVYTWKVGDVIDFLKTNVTSVHEKGNKLTVTFDGNQTATYKLSQQQHDTQFQLQPDGHGGTELTLVPIVGVGHAHHDVAGHLV